MISGRGTDRRASTSRLPTLDPGDLREAAIVREHLLDPVLPHHPQVNTTPRGEPRVIFQKYPRLPQTRSGCNARDPPAREDYVAAYVPSS